MSVEAQIEAAQLGYWAHIYRPTDMQSVYQFLVEQLAAAKAAYRAAREAENVVAERSALAEINDLNLLCAAAADGIAAARRRWLSTDRPWPLMPTASRDW